MYKRQIKSPHYQILLDLDRQHSRQLKTLLTSDPFVDGSIISFKRRCGKKGCCCLKGEPHESLIVSRRVKGKLKVVYTPAEDRPFLLACKDHWQEFRKNKKRLVDLQEKILRALTRFVALKTEKYRPERTKGSAKG